MLISSRSSHPKPGGRTILATWALVTISLSSCQGAVSPMGPSSEDPELQTAAEISAISGDAQVGAPGEALGKPLVVKVTDASGDPVSGILVTWVVSDSGDRKSVV